MSDLISKQAILNSFKRLCDLCGKMEKYNGVMCRACSLDDAIDIVDDMKPEVIRCRDCKWWQKDDHYPFGYCNAIKHGCYTEHWDISISRKYKEDFFCADAEPREENDDDDDE